MSATQELIAAALRLAALAERNTDDRNEWQHAIDSVREGCARAMVQPDMVEVERLIDAFGSSCDSVKKFGHITSFKPIGQQITERREARAALLAHIQRGAVPEGWQVVPKEPTKDMVEVAYDNVTGGGGRAAIYAAMLAAAPAPDHFRDDPDPLHLSRILHELAGAASLCWEPRPTGVFDSQLAIQFVEQALAEIRSRMTSAPAEVPMPEPVAYGFGNTAITGHTNRLMMVRIDVPLDDQYAGAFWLPLVLADEARTYGAACRAAGYAAGVAAVRDYAVMRWYAEVSNRPLVNTHRRTLDDTWRQVIRHTGGDPETLIGPCHDVLVAMREEVKS